MRTPAPPQDGPRPRAWRLLRSSSLTALALLLPVLLAVPAEGRPLQLSVTPALPTWREPVLLVVAGMGCGASLRAPTTVPTGPDAGTLEVGLDDICNIVSPPIAVPFRLEADLGRLEPGTYSVRVPDLESPDDEAATLTFDVYSVTTADLDVGGLTTDREPPEIRVGAFHGCLGTDWRIDGLVITLEIDGGCPLLPPAPALHYDEIPLPALPPGLYDVRLLDFTGAVGGRPPGLLRRALRVWDADGCVPGDDMLCLRDGRFAASASWRDYDGNRGSGQAVSLPGNDGSGLFRFFGADNVELTLKLLDGCAVNGHWWVFLSSSSTVEYEVVVSDARSGTTRTYGNELGRRPSLVADVEGFECP